MASMLNGHDMVTGLRLVDSEHERVLPQQHSAVRGEFTKLPPSHSIWSSMARQGFIGQIFVVLGTAAAVVPVGLPAIAVPVMALVVGAWLILNMATMPAYERAGSFAPAKRMVYVVATVALVAIIANQAISHDLRATVMALFVMAGLSAISALVHRLAMRRVPTLLVGPADAVNRLQARWENRKDLEVIGACTWDPTVPMASATVNSVIRDVPRMLHTARGARVVVTADDAMADPSLRHLAWGLRRAEVECLILADMHDYVEYVRPTKVGDQLALALDQPSSHLVSRALKAIADRTLAALALILLSPVMAVIALAIRMDAAGSILFRQERTGKDGVPFVIYKFRTMVEGAHGQMDDLLAQNEGAGPLFKMTEDPRVTPVGRFLRRTSLDELPQLVNVVAGNMSMVGPRPAIESETSQYSPWVWRRLHVKPGITGLWQVSGRSTLSWDESIRLDLKYVNNWNLRMDARILLKTFAVVLSRKGAW